ncbi:homoserine dehydrogenase [Limnothrix sp. FACHB-881]|uniref:homoserine dehydrogenase n=1 Tax=Limnothrix sp. FACHB-881 TaxID=2692819 RepID=UPI0016864664|nr:homoserine dehydrogenase [Limnothrix sp. FACHB-881]
MGFKVGLLGLGTVGAGVAQILLDATGRSPLLQSLELYRVGARSLDKPRPVEIPREQLTTDLQSIVTDPDVDIVVEVIGGLEPARSLMLEAIRHGKHVVTANKAAIARFGPELFDAAKQAGVYLMLEAAVGGGIPIIQPLKQSLGGDRLNGITGIINGTTNYILSRMTAEGADFGDVLADAQRLGYAEADPTADVDGLDAADKIAILASLAFGGRIKREAVHTEGIRNITATDITYADKLGFAIKLLAIARRQGPAVSLRVHPTLVPHSHPLARVDGAFNAIFVEGQPIGQVMFFGPGAGSGPTASAVVSDVLNVAAAMQATGERATPVINPMLACSHSDFCPIASLDDLETRFYVRFLTSDRPGTIGHIGSCFGNRLVSLESLVQTEVNGDEAQVVVVTHAVREGDFRAALADIHASDAIRSVASVLRVI